MSRLSRAVAVAALAGGTLVAGLLPTVAATGATTPVITLTANSKIRVTHDVLVVYQGGTYATARISGTVTGAASGETLTVIATRFDATTPTSVGAVTLGSTHTSYSFTVTPTLATRYEAVLTQGSTTVATSKAKTVYVTPSGKVSGQKVCARPTCRETLRLVQIQPPSALATEMAKRWYPYFNVALSNQGEPAPPRWLYLGRGHASVSRPRRLAAGKFTVSISYRFFIGNHGYNWQWTACVKDTEAIDGLGLPGTHGCGLTRVSNSVTYLG